MSNKYLMLGLVGVLLVVGGLFVVSKNNDAKTSYTAPVEPTSDLPPVVPSAGVSVTTPAEGAPATPGVKEFSMDSWMEKVGDKMTAHFSLAEMVVKKGDTVRVKLKNTKGTHDFKIDEFKVDLETPEGKEVMVEFVADKVGDFEFYCSKYNHRQIGQKGTLRVTE